MPAIWLRACNINSLRLCRWCFTCRCKSVSFCHRCVIYLITNIAFLRNRYFCTCKINPCKTKSGSACAGGFVSSQSSACHSATPTQFELTVSVQVVFHLQNQEPVILPPLCELFRQNVAFLVNRWFCTCRVNPGMTKSCSACAGSVPSAEPRACHSAAAL